MLGEAANNRFDEERLNQFVEHKESINKSSSEEDDGLRKSLLTN